MKKYILLTLTLIALAFNAQANGGGGSTGDPFHYYYIELKCEPTAAGLVYANASSATESQAVDVPPKIYNSARSAQSNLSKNSWFIATTSSDAKKYKFVKWIDETGKTVSTTPTHNFKWNSSKATVGVPENENEVNNGDKSVATKWNGVISQTFTAVYEEIINQYVSVSSAQPDLGVARIDKPENLMGEEVTISAHPSDYDCKFEYWEKDGVIFSYEPKITFEIDNDNKGDYIAVFSNGYSFWRIRNKGTNRYINAVSDQGSVTDFSALQLTTSQKAQSDPGSIWEITNYQLKGRTAFVYEYEAQNFNSNSYYVFENTASAFISSSHEIDDNTWKIFSNLPTYMSDKGESFVSQSADLPDDKLRWYYEPMDKDLTTKENYFTFDPEKLLFDENTGKYYTTLRTAWNVLFDTNEIKAYIVTGVNEGGVLTKTEVTGGIIPKNTCVLIECNSNDTDRNVMVPTNTAASFTATNDNILVSSEKYFPNQNALESNYKALTLINGALGFGGEACSKINGNDAYMQRDDDVFVSSPKLLDLTTVISENNTTKKYNMTDLICVKAVPNLDDGSAILYCKDDNGYVDKDKNEKGDNDYILNVFSGDGYRDSHDQSNWIALYAPAELFPTNAQSAPGLKDEQPVANSAMLGLQEQKINNVVGVMTDLKNPALTLKSLPVANVENKYTLNTYVPANFKGTQNGYFFISPKPMEIAQIRWAVWTGDHFVNIPKTAISNTADLEGSFDVDFSLMESDIRPVENGIYDFVGLIKIKDEAQLQAADEMDAAKRYVVYPFNLNHTFDIVEGFPTGIKDVDIKDVKSVKYYNLMGHGSDAPHKGVNIIVTTMKDGTTKTSKRVF